MGKTGNGVGVLQVFVGAASYGLLSPVFKLAVNNGWNVPMLTFLQVLFGTALLWIVMLIRNRFRISLRFGKGIWMKLIVIGICGLSLTTVFINQALARLDASLTIVLLFQYAWITILLECIRAKRRPSRGEWTAVILIFAGTILAVGLLERDIGQLDAIGLMYGLLSAITYSLFFFLSGFLPSSLEPFAKSSVMSAASLVFVAAILAADLGSPAGSGTVPIVVWGLLLGVLGTALPTICFNTGIPKIGPGLAALLGALELPVTVLASYGLLGEPLSWLQGGGILLILAGILAVQVRAGGTADS